VGCDTCGHVVRIRLTLFVSLLKFQSYTSLEILGFPLERNIWIERIIFSCFAVNSAAELAYTIHPSSLPYTLVALNRMSVWLEVTLITICKSQLLLDGSARHWMKLCISLLLTSAPDPFCCIRGCVLSRSVSRFKAPECLEFTVITVATANRGHTRALSPTFCP
jgi:hypothetical protein